MAPAPMMAIFKGTARYAAWRANSQWTGAGCTGAASSFAASSCLRRIGRSTNHAISAATAFMMLATTNTACQLPVMAGDTLGRGTLHRALRLGRHRQPAVRLDQFA